MPPGLRERKALPVWGCKAIRVQPDLRVTTGPPGRPAPKVPLVRSALPVLKAERVLRVCPVHPGLRERQVLKVLLVRLVQRGRKVRLVPQVLPVR